MDQIKWSLVTRHGYHQQLTTRKSIDVSTMFMVVMFINGPLTYQSYMVLQ
jgi:hypothetical protein